LVAQSQTWADPFDLVGDLAPFQSVTWTPPTELFFQRLGQLRSADAEAFLCLDLGAEPGDGPVAPIGHRLFEQGVTTRKAVSLFAGVGPGAMLGFNAATSPRAKSLSQSRTVSSRTANASTMRRLVQPASVNSTARADAVQDATAGNHQRRCHELAIDRGGAIAQGHRGRKWP